MKKLRWGVLSTARIARDAVIPAIQSSQFGEVVAIASRDLARARKVASECGIARPYGSYKALLADREVDAVYVPLPNHLHVTWAIRSLEAGKHVLCEKPIALSVAEGEKLVQASSKHPKLKVMEAFMYRFHPQWQMARQIVHEGRIGQLRTIHTTFTFFEDDPRSIVNQADIGGGALMDIGCYGISVARYIFDAEPQRVMGSIERDPTTKIDRLTSAILEFFQGTATFTCATQLSLFQHVHIFGTTGSIEIELPFNPPIDKGARLWLRSEATPNEPATEEIRVEICDQYALQADAFAWAVFDNAAVPTPLADAIANMRVIERVLESVAKGAWA